MIGELGRRSATALLLHSALIQAVTFLVRPAATYRALELDVPGSALGLLAASYAVFPLLLAVPTGGLVDRLGERRLMAIGSGVVLALLPRSCCSGARPSPPGHWNRLPGRRGSWPAWWDSRRWWPTTPPQARMDSAFGYLTFAASLGQARGRWRFPWWAATQSQPGHPDDRPARRVHERGCFSEPPSSSSAEVSGGRKKAGATKVQPRGSAISLLEENAGVARALATSATVLAVVGMTMVYLPALGTDRGLTAATVGAMLTVRAVSSRCARLLLGRVSRKIGRMRSWSPASLCPLPPGCRGHSHAGLAAVCGDGCTRAGPWHRPAATMSWLSAQAPAGQRGRALALRLAGNRVGQVICPSAIGVCRGRPRGSQACSSRPPWWWAERWCCSAGSSSTDLRVRARGAPPRQRLSRRARFWVADDGGSPGFRGFPT